jgi:Spy/CpxP family protein refolding chaperone
VQPGPHARRLAGPEAILIAGSDEPPLKEQAMKALILAGLSVPAAITGVHAGFHAHMHQHLQEMLVQKLGLTQAQQDAAHTIVEAHHPALRAKAQTAFKLRADLMQALANPQTTEAQIREMEGLASAAHLALELEVNQVVREIAPLLTPEQHLKAQKLVVDARAHIEGFLAGMSQEGMAK